MDELTGKQLGPYQVVAPLGEGGMAAVYKAYQPSIDRYVALKVLPRHYAKNPEFVQRFTQEARVIARLQHPHILPVHDFGETDGYTFLAMRWVQGGTLADWMVANQPLSLAQIRRIFTQIGDAVDYAHSNGVIHRDIKPSNVLLDERGNCLLTDFGLAKMVAASVKLTQTGGILGTPAYMSPEQGLGQTVDQRSDIYALGVVLYELVTGRPPYQAETPMAIMIKHIQSPLPPPREFNSDIPEALERAVMKALAKKPEDRFHTAGEMVKAVQAGTDAPTLPSGQTAVSPPPVTVTAVPSPKPTAPPPSTPQPTPPHTTPAADTAVPTAKPARRRPPLPLILGAALVLVAVLAVIGIIGRNRNGDGDNGETQLDVPAAIQPLLAEAARHNEAGNFTAALTALDEAIATEPEIANLYCERGFVLRSMQAFSEAVDSFAACAALAAEQRIPEIASQAQGGTAVAKADQMMAESGDVDVARAIYNDALNQEGAPDWLFCERGEFLFGQQARIEALDDYYECADRVRDDFWQRRSQTIINQLESELAMENGDFEAAVSYLERWAEQAPDEPWPYCALGFVHNQLGEHEAAIVAYENCMRRAPEDSDLAWQADVGMTSARGYQAHLDGELPQSIELLSAAIELDDTDPWLFCARGYSYWDLGDIEAARRDFEQCASRSGDDIGARDEALEALDELNAYDP